MSRLSNSIYFLSFVLFIFVLGTNQYFAFTDAVTIMGQADMASYHIIAHSAPSLPSQEIVYHHAQRAFLPYFIGSISNLAAIDVEIHQLF